VPGSVIDQFISALPDDIFEVNFATIQVQRSRRHAQWRDLYTVHAPPEGREDEIGNENHEGNFLAIDCSARVWAFRQTFVENLRPVFLQPNRSARVAALGCRKFMALLIKPAQR
jgi:hypothetical protein